MERVGGSGKIVCPARADIAVKRSVGVFDDIAGVDRRVRQAVRSTYGIGRRVVDRTAIGAIAEFDGVAERQRPIYGVDSIAGMNTVAVGGRRPGRRRQRVEFGLQDAGAAVIRDRR